VQSKKIQTTPLIKTILSLAIASVWLINGLFCKLLNFAPRHQVIVGRILGEEQSFLFTKIIGISEVFMFIWIISKIKSSWCSVSQIAIIAVMNTIEFMLVPDILLFGRINALVALMLIVVIFCNEFILKTETQTVTGNI